MAERGFLLLCFLMVFAVLLATVVLGLGFSPWLWRAGGAMLAGSDQHNLRRASLVQLKQWLDQGQIPSACWHESPDLEAAKAAFMQRPQFACRLAVGDKSGFYWLEQWPQINRQAPQARAYQLWLIDPAGFAEVYGFEPNITTKNSGISS